MKNRQRLLRKSAIERLTVNSRIKTRKKKLLGSTTANPDSDVMKSYLPEDDRTTDQELPNHTVPDGALPRFVFVRFRDVEQEADFFLAGKLFLNEPKLNGKKMPNETRQEADIIIQFLIKTTQDGLLSDDVIVIGWPGYDGVFNVGLTEDDDHAAVLETWAEGRLCIMVEVEYGNSFH